MESSPLLLLRLPHTTLDCRPGIPQGAHVMGILNVTPDSFSDGGTYLDTDTALFRVEQMLDEGAAMIDVGGESTRPGGRTYGAGASAVAEQEERERVIPVIKGISSRFPEAIISIDTYKPTIAREAIQAGAHIINDVTGLRLYPEMANVAAAAKVPLILMHSIGRPGELPHEHHYADVIRDVFSSLEASVQLAKEAGVEHLIVDPGFGFGKSPQENMRLMNEVDRFTALGYPILIGVSRKSSIGIVLGNREHPRPVDERLYGSLGVTAVAVLKGASLVRTHDVRPTVDFLKALGATVSSGSA